MGIDLEKLIVGENYDRPYLAKLWGYKTWHAIARGIVTPKNKNKIILFVTKIKQPHLTQYTDYLKDNLLYMEGEINHANDDRIIKSTENDDEIFLFYREKHHTPFTFYGKVYLVSYTKRSSKPSSFIFALTENDAAALSSLITEQAAHGQVDEKFFGDEEGKRRLYTHVHYERSRKNRAKAIEIHGTKCKVCGFDFNKFYGKKLARNYIEIHHIKSITKVKGVVNPKTDLVPLCSNCHSMIHRDKNKILPIEELKRIIKEAKNIQKNN